MPQTVPGHVFWPGTKDLKTPKNGSATITSVLLLMMLLLLLVLLVLVLFLLLSAEF